MTDTDLTPTTPYLIRAIYDWCTDQHLTPHLLVDATVEGVIVPFDLVENGAIVLNLRPSAIKNLDLGNEWVLFRARFSGTSMDVNVPIQAVRAIFAQENGLGCAFEAISDKNEAITSLEPQSFDENSTNKPKPSQRPSKTSKTSKKHKKPHLKLVE